MNDETLLDSAVPNSKQQQVKTESRNVNNTPKAATQNSNKEGSNSDSMKKVVGASGLGAAAGIAVGLITPLQVFPEQVEIEDVLPNDAETAAHTSDSELSVATTVDDSMSFSQAFAAARHELGAGGVFMWHGHTYGTYYANEWNAMSDDAKEQYWANVNHTTAHINDNLGNDLVNNENQIHDNSSNDDILLNPDGSITINESDIVDVIDIDGDGVDDAVVVDVNQNGVADLLIDSTGDGYCDTLLVDVGAGSVH